MTTQRATALQSIERNLGLMALLAVAAAGWLFLIRSESAMLSMDGDGPVMDLMWRMMQPGDAGPYLAAATLMWVVMMIAMMVPSVVPMTVVFRRLDRGDRPGLDATVFASGYLVAWAGFSVVAAALQWWLHAGGMLHGMELATAGRLTAAVLVAAGVYQLTPLKEACLARCRGPMGFFLEHWRDGRLGALRMGLGHGLYCMGCCWALMLLMFAGGAMSVITMAALSVFILAERVLPAGPWVTRLPGFALIGWGAVLWPGLP
ncbi:MAG: DUF2182 domain-containing protein [Gammaproteobacteria bacterium]